MPFLAGHTLPYYKEQRWHEVVRDYRLSNKEMAFINSVLTAYDALKDGWTNRHYFYYTEQELEAHNILPNFTN